MAKVGRPKDTVADRLTEGWQERMLELAKEGASEVELRVELGISDDLWYRWIDEEPEFARTVKDCKRRIQAWWERHGRHMAVGAEGNATVWIFNMKNRFGWRDKNELALTGADGGAIDVNHTVTFVSPDGSDLV